MAASIPHHYCSDYTTTNFSIPCHEEMFNNNMAPLMMSYHDMNSPVSVGSFPEQQFGVLSDCSMAAVPQMSELDMGFGDYQHQVLEECSGLVPNLWPNYPTHQEWGIKGKAVTKKVEESSNDGGGEVKVGRYSVEERKDRILRYLKKRNQRNFNKTIKYACRKTLADKRVRVRGRFAKNNEPSEEEVVMKTSHDIEQNYHTSFYDQDSFQMKYDEDDWLQTAVANLAHLPYLAS